MKGVIVETLTVVLMAVCFIMAGYTFREGQEKAEQAAKASQRNAWIAGPFGGEWYLDDTGEIAAFRKRWDAPIFYFGSATAPAVGWDVRCEIRK